MIPLQLSTLLSGYAVDVSGKVGSDKERKRIRFYPSSTVLAAPPALQGGIGVTISGVSMNEVYLLFNASTETRNILFEGTYIARLIKFKAVADVVRDVTDIIISTTERSNSKVTVTTPQGTVLKEAFQTTAHVVAIDELSRAMSERANTDLKQMGIKLAPETLYSGIVKSSIQDSVQSALAKNQVKYLENMHVINELKSSAYVIRTIMENLSRIYPLLSMITIQPTFQPVQKRYNATRLQCCADGLLLVYQTVGMRARVPSPRGSPALAAYTKVINAARRIGTLNPAVTDSSLRDIIEDALRSTNTSSMDLVVSNVLTAMFGNLPDLSELVNGIVGAKWNLKSAELAYTLSGSALVYVDLDESNVARLVNMNAHTSFSHHAKAIGVLVASGLASLNGIFNAVEVIDNAGTRAVLRLGNINEATGVAPDGASIVENYTFSGY